MQFFFLDQPCFSRAYARVSDHTTLVCMPCQHLFSRHNNALPIETCSTLVCLIWMRAIRIYWYCAVVSSICRVYYISLMFCKVILSQSLLVCREVVQSFMLRGRGCSNLWKVRTTVSWSIPTLSVTFGGLYLVSLLLWFNESSSTLHSLFS